MSEQKPSLHYYFIYQHLKDLVLNQYDLFVKLLQSGPTRFLDILVEQWNLILQNNPNRFTHTELPAERPFNLGFMTDEKKRPAIFCIEPPMATIVPEALVAAIMMFEDHARFFTLELSDSHIVMQQMVDGGQIPPPETPIVPAYVMGECTQSGHLNLGKIYKVNEFFDKIMDIARSESEKINENPAE